MSSRLSVEQGQIINSGSALAGHSLNQRAIKRCLDGQGRVGGVPKKVDRAAERRARMAMEAEAEAVRQEAEQLDILYDDILSGAGPGETIVGTVEGQRGIVHEIGIVYVAGSSML